MRYILGVLSGLQLSFNTCFMRFLSTIVAILTTVRANTHLLLCGILSCMLLSTAHASTPLWTITPLAGSNPTQTVAENSTASVQYQILNQSQKPKRLAMLAIPGISNTALCTLAPRGQAGDSCIVSLDINGRALPQEGIHQGPSVCQTDAYDKPNPNQCYQPSVADSLNITRDAATPVPVAQLSVSPTVLMFAQNMTGTLTVFNNSTSTVAAFNVDAVIAAGSAISVSANNCPSSLAVGISCTITLTSTAVEGPTSVTINGSNTNSLAVPVTVTATPTALLTVNPPSLTFTVGGTGTVNVTNSSSSAVAANGITSVIPSSSSITENSNTCLPSLAAGDTCSITYQGPVVEGPTNITVRGNNTTSENLVLTVASTPTATISLSPSTLTFTAGGNGALTVTNNGASTVSAMALDASIPQGSTIRVLNNGCTANLAPGASCDISFTSPVGAAATVVTVSGSNTNAPTASITVDPVCTPITLSSTPGVSIFNSSGQVTNVSRVIDVILSNFATMDIRPIVSIAPMIEIAFQTNNYVKIGFKTKTENASVINYTLQAYNQNGALIQAISGTLHSGDQEYSFNTTSAPIARLRLTVTDLSFISTTQLYYFCAG